MASLGHRLRETRLQHGLTEEQVSQETRISLANIRSLETDNYAIFDSPVYAKGFVKTYGTFLGLNVSEILSKFDEHNSDEAIFSRNCSRLEDTERPLPSQRNRSPLILAPVLVGIFGFLCFSLFSLFTGGSLPFGPSKAEATPKQVEPAAAQLNLNEDAEDEDAVLIPVNLPEEPDRAIEGGNYLDDFHASADTIYLQMGGEATRTAVLP